MLCSNEEFEFELSQREEAEQWPLVEELKVIACVSVSTVHCRLHSKLKEIN